MADAINNYASWRIVGGADEPGKDPSGTGLPTNLINDLLVTRNGTVYAATTLGLAWSKDKGQSWQFVRGKDYADKVRHLPGGPERSWREGPTWLAEDYVTALAEGYDGRLLLGFRSKGCQSFDPASGAQTLLEDRWVKSILPSVSGQPIVGTYGNEHVLPIPTPLSAATSDAPPLPAGAAPPTVQDVAQLTQRIKSATDEAKFPRYFGEDWATQGDWMGRYGHQFAILCAMTLFNREYSSLPLKDRPFHVTGQIGPDYWAKDTLRQFNNGDFTERATDPRVLYWAGMGGRRQASWDDHGEAYSIEAEGPDLWITVQVPEGIHRVGLYFVNYNGHDGVNRLRDYLIELRQYSTRSGDDHDQRRGFSPPSKTRPLEDLRAALAGPVLARARVSDFYGGVYKQFLVKGPTPALIRIQRNFSHNTILSGVFVDTFHGPVLAQPRRPLEEMGKVRYEPRSKPLVGFMRPNLYQAAHDLWETLDDNPHRALAVDLQTQARLASYRLMTTDRNASSLLSYWRWSLPMWSSADRVNLKLLTDQAWKEFSKLNPDWVKKFGDKP